MLCVLTSAIFLQKIVHGKEHLKKKAGVLMFQVLSGYFFETHLEKCF